MKQVEEKIVQLAHEFVKKYGEDALKIKQDDRVKYIIPNLNRYEQEIFKHNQFKLLVLFHKTIVTDLRKSKKQL